MAAFALVHSPLTGPSTWGPVSASLEAGGQRTVVPALVDSPSDGRPYWQQHAASAARAIDNALGGLPCVLVGHSGAGSLLPAIQSCLHTVVVGRIFVDAGIPLAGASRLDMMKRESAAWAEQLEQHLQNGGRFPEWKESDLQKLIPNDDLRRRTLHELRPRTLDFFTEPLPVPDTALECRSGYIQFSEAYDFPASQAEAFGWPTLKITAGHFHMLVDPTGVGEMLVALLARLSELH